MAVYLLSNSRMLELINCSSEEICILDARTEEEFSAGHIVGAQIIRWENFCGQPPSDSHVLLSEPGYWGLMADPISWRLGDKLSTIGLTNKKKIVVYADGPLSWGTEGRVAWMLLYLGA